MSKDNPILADYMSRDEFAKFIHKTPRTLQRGCSLGIGPWTRPKAGALSTRRWSRLASAWTSRMEKRDGARIMITSWNYRSDKWKRGSHKPQDAAIMEQLIAEEGHRQAKPAAEQERRRQARPPKPVAL
jgi:hypothetical protein